MFGQISDQGAMSGALQGTARDRRVFPRYARRTGLIFLVSFADVLDHIVCS